MQNELTSATSLRACVPHYRAYLIGEQRRPAGRDRYLWGLGRFLSWIETRIGHAATQADLTPEMVRRYKEVLGARCATATVINALAVVRDFASWAIAEGLRSTDPTAGMKRPRKKRPAPNPLYEEDIVLMRAAITLPDALNERQRWQWERNVRTVLCFLYTGMRLSEMAACRWKHIKLQAGIIEVRGGKNDKDRIIPIHPVIRALLLAVPAEERKRDMPLVGKRTKGRVITPMTDRGLAKVFSRWLKTCLRDAMQDEAFHVHAHRLRHTFASLLVWAGKDLRTVQELLGHEQLGTTEWYVQVKDAQKHDAVNALPSF